MPIPKREPDAYPEEILSPAEMPWRVARVRNRQEKNLEPLPEDRGASGSFRRSGVKKMIEFEEVRPYTEGGGARPRQPGFFVAQYPSLLAARRSPLAARGPLS
jgi:hypothetical protein